MAVGINILSSFDSKGIDKALKDFGKLETNSQKAGFALQKSFVPALAVLGGLAAGLGFATKAAVEDKAAQEQLAGVLERATGATGAAVSQNEKWISSLSRATATADDVLRPALASLANATGDLGEAQSLLTVAQDLAAATNSDLGTAVDALSKAYNGNFKGLKALDPALAGVIKSGADFNEVMGVLAERTGGAAADAANTAAGKMAGLKIAMDETKESIGMALLPVMEALVKILEPMAKWAQDNSTLFLVLIGVVGGLAAAVVGLNIALKVQAAVTGLVTAAQWLLNVAMTANPIGLIIVGVAALVAAFVILEVKFGLVSKAVGFFSDYLKIALKPLWLVIDGVQKLIDLIKKVDLSKIPGAGVIGGIAGGIGDLFGGIPGLAEGGIVTRPTLAMIGEGGGPEAVIPLSKMGRMGNTNYYVTVNAGLVTNKDELADTISDLLSRRSRLNGGLAYSSGF